MAKYRMRFVDIKGLGADEIKHIRLPEASAKKDKENVMTYTFRLTALALVRFERVTGSRGASRRQLGC
jgi:hypothetical protein